MKSDIPESPLLYILFRGACVWVAGLGVLLSESSEVCELQYSADTITQHDSGMIGQRAGDSKCDRGWITAKT